MLFFYLGGVRDEKTVKDKHQFITYGNRFFSPVSTRSNDGVELGEVALVEAGDTHYHDCVDFNCVTDHTDVR